MEMHRILGGLRPDELESFRIVYEKQALHIAEKINVSDVGSQDQYYEYLTGYEALGSELLQYMSDSPEESREMLMITRDVLTRTRELIDLDRKLDELSAMVPRATPK